MHSFSLVVLSYLFLYVCLFTSDTLVSGSIIMYVYVLVALMIFTCILILLWEHSLNKNKKNYENEQINRFTNYTKEYLEDTQKELDLLKELINSDFSMLEDEKKINITNLYTAEYCSNETINIIMNLKATLAKQHTIVFKSAIFVPDRLPFTPAKIISVYSNLLDNAIESCQKVAVDRRWITFQSMVYANYLIIKIENAKLSTITVDMDNNISTKKNTSEHGIGLYIIKDICKEYNGVFKITNYSDSVSMYVSLRFPD